MGRAVVVGADGTEGLARGLAVTVRVVLVAVAGVLAPGAVAGGVIVRKVPSVPVSGSSPS